MVVDGTESGTQPRHALTCGLDSAAAVGVSTMGQNFWPRVSGAEPHSFAHTICCRDKFDALRRQCLQDQDEAAPMRVVAATFEIAHGAARQARCLGQLFLAPIQQTARRAALRGRKRQ